MSTKPIAALLLILILIGPARALELRGATGIHDPSTILKRDGVYHVWGTGDGVIHLTSPDLITWSAGPPVFAPGKWPGWINKYVPDFKGFFWAPECYYLNGQYYLYYSCSTGKRPSAIGLATSPDLTNWTDRGMIVHSDERSPYGSIDAAIFRDVGSNLWLAFGSHLKGIWLAPLDPKTGKRRGDTLYNVATHFEAEAAYLLRRGAYYYLFYNIGVCCAGMNSTYRILMGRSKTITGPYLDRDGKDLARGGGTLFLGTDGEHIGAGHFGILREENIERFSFHFYNGLANGWPTLGLQTLVWDAQGWPRPAADLAPGRYAIVSKASGLSLGVHDIGFAEGTPVDQFTYLDNPFQHWNVSPVGDGYYGIASLGTGAYIDLFECSPRDGTKIGLYPWMNNDCQRWRIEPTGDGTFRILNKGGGTAVTLPGGTKTPQALIEGHAWKNDDGQQWIFKKVE